jgi:DNA-binding transcriptional ArsR family regulator
MERLLQVPRRVISFHLRALEEVGLVRSEFGLSDDERPQAVRYYSATAEGKVTFDRITYMLKRH